MDGNNPYISYIWVYNDILSFLFIFLTILIKTRILKINEKTLNYRLELKNLIFLYL